VWTIRREEGVGFLGLGSPAPLLSRAALLAWQSPGNP